MHVRVFFFGFWGPRVTSLTPVSPLTRFHDSEPFTQYPEVVFQTLRLLEVWLSTGI